VRHDGLPPFVRKRQHSHNQTSRWGQSGTIVQVSVQYRQVTGTNPKSCVHGYMIYVPIYFLNLPSFETVSPTAWMDHRWSVPIHLQILLRGETEHVVRSIRSVKSVILDQLLLLLSQIFLREICYYCHRSFRGKACLSGFSQEMVSMTMYHWPPQLYS